jgi:hypothetical protein
VKNMMMPYTAPGMAISASFNSVGLSATVTASAVLWMPISNPAAVAAACSTPASRGTPYPTSRLTMLNANAASPTDTK